MNILEVENLSKDYGEFKLNNINFSIPRGRIMGLIGENGAGKTTTINLILNEIKKDSGNIKIMGKDNLEHEVGIKDKIGVVFDECFFPDYFNALDIQKIMMNIYSQWDKTVFEDFIKRFNLPDKRMIKKYSKGMKMKLAIIVALAHNAEFLILDEATSGLDPVVRDEILDILLDFVQKENHSVLFSSHITSDLEKVADYITFIHEGKLVFSKRKDTLIKDYGILICDKNIFKNMDKNDIITFRKNDNEFRVLVIDKVKMKEKYSGCFVARVTIEDIMLFYIRGNK